MSAEEGPMSKARGPEDEGLKLTPEQIRDLKVIEAALTTGDKKRRQEMVEKTRKSAN